MKKFITCLLAALGLTAACGQNSYEDTNVAGFAKLMTDTSVVVLDVRTAAEYAEGHIKRSINIDQAQGDFIERVKATIPQHKRVAVYCKSGRRSAKAATRLSAAGYRCINLRGGILAWKAAKMPVEPLSYK